MRKEDNDDQYVVDAHPTNRNIVNVFRVGYGNSEEEEYESMPVRNNNNNNNNQTEYDDLIVSSLKGPTKLGKQKPPNNAEAVPISGFAVDTGKGESKRRIEYEKKRKHLNSHQDLFEEDPEVTYASAGPDNGNGGDDDREDYLTGETYYPLEQDPKTKKLTGFGKNGAFLHDWYSGTPLDEFNFDALKRYMLRKAEMLTNPVIQFVADVAVKCGSSLEQMVVNPQRPLVKMNAQSVNELMAQSRLGSDMLSVVMAYVLVEMFERTFQKKKEKEYKLVLVKKEPQELDLTGGTPLKRVKSEPLLKKEESINFPLGKIIEAQSKLEAHCIGMPMPIEMSHGETDLPPLDSFDLIGAGPAPNPVRLMRDRDLAPNPAEENPILKDILSVLKYSSNSRDMERWNFNSLPENVGFSIIKQEVVQSIRSAYEDIRRIDAERGEFKLYHLMTSPSVQHHFALMVASFLNAIPSELQYPNQTTSYRNNGAVTGAKISSGVYNQARQASLYKQKRKWFSRVVYETSSEWKRVTESLPTAKGKIDTMRKVFWGYMDKLVVFTSYIQDMLRLHVEYTETVRDYDKASRVLTALQLEEKELREMAEKTQVQLATLTEKQGLIKTYQVDLLPAIRKRAMQQITDDLRRSGSPTVKWIYHFFDLFVIVSRFTGIPGLPVSRSYLIKNGAEEIDITRPNATAGWNSVPSNGLEISSTFPERFKKDAMILLSQLQNGLVVTTRWRDAGDNDASRQKMYEGVELMTNLLQSLQELQNATAYYTQMVTNYHSFSEDQKRELVYRPPSASEVRPMIDYSIQSWGPGNNFASY